MDEFRLEAWQRAADDFAWIAGGYSCSILKIQQQDHSHISRYAASRNKKQFFERVVM